MHRPTQKRERLRADPLVSITTIFEGIITDMKECIEGVHDFLLPVDKKRVPDYHDIIMKPMCIQSIKDKLRQHKYSTREEFLEDFELITSNSELYNGPISEITMSAQKMQQYIQQRMVEDEDKLIKLERQINPLLDDNDQNQLSFTLTQFMEKFDTIEGAALYFQRPVDRKKYPDYYPKITNPIDLGMIRKNISRHYYQNRMPFIEDIQLIHENSLKYNGPDHIVSKTAMKIVEMSNQLCIENDDKLKKMEDGIIQSQESNKMFLDDLELSDNDINESDYEQDTLEPETMESLEPTSFMTEESQGFASTLDGLEMSSDDDAPPESASKAFGDYLTGTGLSEVSDNDSN